MQNIPDVPGQTESGALRQDLLDADDRKIRRILAVVDEVADPRVNQTLLDPLRPRLAALRPVRPLRFSRLLFLPLDSLIVPARAWTPGEPSIPRSALAAIALAVRTGMGEQAQSIDKMIAGCKVDAARAVAPAGEALWPRAAEILAVARMPDDWAKTGLRLDAWPLLAKAVAALLRRATSLRRLAQDAEVGAVELDSGAVSEILRYRVDEPPEAYEMLVRLILWQVPHATSLLRKIASLCRNPAEQAMMRQAIEREMDRVVSDMENSPAFGEEIARAGLADAATEVRRITALLREMERETNAVMRRSRLKAIREKLDVACQERFTTGVSEGLVAPLDEARAPVDGAMQRGLETSARDLRRLEIVARKIASNPGAYDHQLQRASEALKEAAAAGTLTPVRQLRLIEILFGSEAAELLYWERNPPGGDENG
jgi:hypothetical protein